jgi:vacuolar-type H+-ATPase subunit H
MDQPDRLRDAWDGHTKNGHTNSHAGPAAEAAGPVSECLNRIEALLQASPPLFSPRRRAARDAELRRLLAQLRRVCSETGEDQALRAEAKAMLRRAQNEARRIVLEAEEHAQHALADGTLARAAEQEGRQIREKAARDAADIRREADAYALEVMGRLEREVARALATIRRGKAILAGRAGAPAAARDGDTAMSHPDDAAGTASPRGQASDAVDNRKMASV